MSNSQKGVIALLGKWFLVWDVYWQFTHKKYGFSSIPLFANESVVAIYFMKYHIMFHEVSYLMNAYLICFLLYITISFRPIGVCSHRHVTVGKLVGGKNFWNLFWRDYFRISFSLISLELFIWPFWYASTHTHTHKVVLCFFWNLFRKLIHWSRKSGGFKTKMQIWYFCVIYSSWHNFSYVSVFITNLIDTLDFKS